MFKRLMILMVLAGLFAGCTAFGEEEEFDERGKILFEGDIAGMGYISDTGGHRRSGVLQVRIGGGKIAQVPFSGDYYSKIELSSPIKVYRDVCIINHSEGELEIGCRGDDVSVRNLIIEQPPEEADMVVVVGIDYKNIIYKNMTANMLHVYSSSRETLCETMYLENRTVEYCRPTYSYKYLPEWTIIYENKSISCSTPSREFVMLTEYEIMELEGTSKIIGDLVLSKYDYNKTSFAIGSRGKFGQVLWCEWSG